MISFPLPQAAASQIILPSLLPSTCPYTHFIHSDIPGHPAAATSLLFQHPQISAVHPQLPKSHKKNAIPALQGFVCLDLNAELSRFWHHREVDQAPKSCRLPHKSLSLSLNFFSPIPSGRLMQCITTHQIKNNNNNNNKFPSKKTNLFRCCGPDLYQNQAGIDADLAKVGPRCCPRKPSKKKN